MYYQMFLENEKTGKKFIKVFKSEEIGIKETEKLDSAYMEITWNVMSYKGKPLNKFWSFFFQRKNK